MRGPATKQEQFFMKKFGYRLRYDEEGHKEFVKDLPTGAQNIIKTKAIVETQEEVDQIVHNISMIASRAAQRKTLVGTVDSDDLPEGFPII